MRTSFDEIDFPEVNEADWRRLADKALAGKAFETLVSRTEDGVEYGPIHTRHVPARPIPRDGAEPWRIVQRIDDPDPKRANAQALEDLEGGANALSLVFEGSPSAHGYGLPLTDAAISTALSGVELEMVGIRIEPHPDLEAAVTALRRVVAEPRKVSFDGLDVDHGLDPVGCYAATGNFPLGNEPDLRQHLGRNDQRLLDELLKGKLIEADGRVYHEAGASEAQELGAVLATAVYYLRALEADAFELSQAIRTIGVTLAADQKQFLVTAKIRAMRLLWARTLSACGIASTYDAVRIHVETSRRMMAARDPHTNILRTTVAAFAAATGGADSISVLPFTAANGLPDAKARRLARNVQTILQDESGLARVVDPAAGSGGIEALTEGLAKAAWEEFRRIETEGGIVESLRKGRLQARIAAAREARRTAVAGDEEAVIGVTLYPLERERDIAVLAPPPAEALAQAGRACEPLMPYRLSAERERRA